MKTSLAKNLLIVITEIILSASTKNKAPQPTITEPAPVDMHPNDEWDIFNDLAVTDESGQFPSDEYKDCRSGSSFVTTGIFSKFITTFCI